MKEFKYLVKMIGYHSTLDILKYLLMIPLNIFGYTFYFISYLVPRRKDIWVFGSWSGKRFSDNSKYMFLHVSNNHRKDINSIWISKNKDIVRKLRERKYTAYYAYELKGIYYNLRAKYIFSDSYFDSVNFWCCGGATKIQLWHGSPIKKEENDANLCWNKTPIKYIYLYFSPWLFTKYDYVISAADIFSDILASEFQLKEKNVLIMGYPRNDSMFGVIDDIDLVDTEIYNEMIDIKQYMIDTKFILYAPTFRDNNLLDNPFIDTNFDFETLNKLLHQTNGFFIIKLHPHVKINLKYNYDRIVFLPNNFDIHSLLSQIDILITDYSCLYFDYLLLDRPIIFFPYDLEKYYKDERELHFNYGEITPGPMVFTFDDLLKWINYFITNENEYVGEFIDKRKKIKDLTLYHKDGESSERIFKYIYNLDKRWKK